MNTLRILFALAALLGSAANSYANFAMSPSGSTTAFAIDAANQGTSLCAAASTECGAVVTIGVDGTPVEGKTSDAAWVSGSGSIVAILKNIANGIASALPAGTNQIGFVGLQANTTGGCTPTHVLSAASTNSTSVKGSAGTICSLTIIQNTATAADFRFYDTASAPTCSSATGVVANYGVQANTTSPGFTLNFGPFGLNTTTGIGFCLTAYDGTDTNNSNSVTGIQIDIAYK